MTAPCIKPVGIIDGPVDGGAVFTLVRPQDQDGLQPDTPVTVWSFHQESGAVARVRGRVSEVSRTTAAFRAAEFNVGPGWPGHVNPLEAGSPVYLATEDSFDLCLDRSAPAQPAELAPETP